MSDAAITRPERYRETIDAGEFGVVEKPLSPFERVYNVTGCASW